MPRVRSNQRRPTLNRIPVRADKLPLVTRLLQYIQRAYETELRDRIDSRWEIVVYIALYLNFTEGLLPAQVTICKEIAGKLPGLIAEGGVQSCRQMDVSLVITGCFLEWLSRSPSHQPPHFWEAARQQLERTWVELSDQPPNDANAALLACNAVASTRMLQTILGPKVMVLSTNHKAVYNQFSAHWRARYVPPNVSGRRVSEEAQDAVYFATHTVMAFWGYPCIVKGDIPIQHLLCGVHRASPTISNSACVDTFNQSSFFCNSCWGGPGWWARLVPIPHLRCFCVRCHSSCFHPIITHPHPKE